MCEWGNHEKVCVKIASDLSGTGDIHWRAEKIDKCIAPIIRAFQNAGIDMRGSCCGHRKTFGNIHLQDGRVLLIINDGHNYRAQKHIYLIKMVARHIFGSYKNRLRIRKNNLIWRFKNLLKWRLNE